MAEIKITTEHPLGLATLDAARMMRLPFELGPGYVRIAVDDYAVVYNLGIESKRLYDVRIATAAKAAKAQQKKPPARARRRATVTRRGSR